MSASIRLKINKVTIHLKKSILISYKNNGCLDLCNGLLVLILKQ